GRVGLVPRRQRRAPARVARRRSGARSGRTRHPPRRGPPGDRIAPGRPGWPRHASDLEGRSMTVPHREPCLSRCLALALGALTCLTGAWCLAPPGLAQDVAAAGNLLRSTPFDRIALGDGTIVDVDPISPRPLPPYDPSKE